MLHDRHRLMSSAFAGILGGIIMALFMIGSCAMVGLGPWLHLKTVGAVILGVEAVIGGASALFIGLIVHLLMSGVFGLLYGFFTYKRESPEFTLWEGMIYGTVIWAVMTFIVLPVADPTMSAQMATISGIWFFAHILFGACFFVIPVAQKSLEDRSSPPQVPAAPHSIWQ